jgi:pyruvate dehydrogenase E2 component (dihydrolipoamide acetyltransferase)
MTLVPFLMPDIGEGVVEGEVVSWLKKEGDRVKKDEPVLILMTDKATVELPSPYAGILAKRCYKEGEIAKKGLPLYEIQTDEKVQVKEEVLAKAPVEEKPHAESKQSVSTHALAAPPVRKMAKEMKADISSIHGSGPNGRVLKEDLVQRAVGDQAIPLIGIQHLMADKMALSHQEIPAFSYFHEADATRLVQLQAKMAEEGQRQGIQVTFMPFFIRALSLTIEKHSLINSSFDKDKKQAILHASRNIGIAMATPLGLIVPVLKHVESLNMNELIHAYDSLKNRAKTNKLQKEDMKEGTISITNFGALSGPGSFATPIINYPEAAILGFSRIEKEPVAYHGQVALRNMLHLSWSFDHRLIDGNLATQVAKTFAHLIENPAYLL